MSMSVSFRSRGRNQPFTGQESSRFTRPSLRLKSRSRLSSREARGRLFDVIFEPLVSVHWLPATRLRERELTLITAPAWPALGAKPSRDFSTYLLACCQYENQTARTNFREVLTFSARASLCGDIKRAAL